MTRLRCDDDVTTTLTRQRASWQRNDDATTIVAASSSTTRRRRDDDAKTRWRRDDDTMTTRWRRYDDTMTTRDDNTMATRRRHDDNAMTTRWRRRRRHIVVSRRGRSEDLTDSQLGWLCGVVLWWFLREPEVKQRWARLVHRWVTVHGRSRFKLFILFDGREEGGADRRTATSSVEYIHYIIIL